MAKVANSLVIELVKEKANKICLNKVTLVNNTC